MEFFKRSGELLEAVLPYKPVKARDDQLADDWRIFGGWYSTLKRKGEFKYTEDEILNKFTVPALKEIIRRGKQEFHPENWKENPRELYLKAFTKVVKPGLYLVEPHGKLIFDKKKKAIVKSKKFTIGNFHILVSGNKAYGFIRLEEPKEISLSGFEALRTKHRITDDEREEWWPDKKILFYYEIRDFIDLDKPQTVSVPRGVQTFIKQVNLKEQLEFKPEEWDAKFISTLKDNQLLEKLSLIKEIFEARGSKTGDEEVINAYILLTDEIKKRKLEFSVIPELEKLAQKLREGVFDKYVLGVKNEINKIGHIIIVPNYVSWTGSSLYAKERMPNDMDIVIRDYKISPDKYLKLQRVLKKLTGEIPCVHMTPEGPNWRHMPLYHLALIPVKSNEFIEVGLEEPGFADKLYEQRAAEPEIRKQAEQSEKENKVKVSRFFLMMKPTRAAKPNHRMTIDYFISLFKPEDFKAGILSSKKYDGMAIETHKDGNKVKILSEDGEVITERLPQIVEAVKKLNRDSLVLGAELEMWKKEKHQPREAVAGYVHAKTPPDDSDLVANVFTKMYEDKDIHEEKEADRQRGLKKINFPQSTWSIPDTKKKLNLVPNLESHSAEELRKHTNFVWKQVASEGNVAKKNDAIYYLDGRSRDGWIKWHGNCLIYGIVIERIQTKTEGVYNYRYGINPQNYNISPEHLQESEEFGRLVEVKNEDWIEVGKSFNTDDKLNRGDLIAIECETFNLIDNKKTGFTEVTAWAPRYIYLDQTEEPVPKTADTIDEVVAKAKKNRVLQKKTITVEGETLYESEQIVWEDIENCSSWEEWKELSESLHESAEEIPEDIIQELELEKEPPPCELINRLLEEKRPEKQYPKNYAIIVNHFRGKSVHLDFRRKQNGSLEGETILNAPKELIKEDVDTITKGKKWNKVLLEKGKFRPDMNPTKKAVLVGKATQPLVWLNVREVSYPPGSVGATRFEWGTFITMDEGTAYPGAQRPYFKEFFLDMKHFKKKRMVERLLGVSPEWEKPPKAPTQWQAWTNMTDETPYILSKRQRKDKRDYIPKEGEKAIPPWWEEKIKPEHRWWKEDLKPKERMQRLDLAYNDLIEKGDIKARPIEIKEEILQEKKAEFTLRFLWWMGPRVIRGLPAADSRFQLLIDSGKKSLDRWDFSGKFYGDPTKQDETPARRTTMNIGTPNTEPFRKWMSWEGSVPAKDSKLTEVKVKKKLDENRYLVVGATLPNGSVEAKPTFAKFKEGQTAWLDQWENLYTGNKGGIAYGNPNERLPVYIDIKDSGTVEWIEDTELFSSFKFDGKLLKGYWVMRREDPKSDIWIFSKGKLPGEKLETKEELYFVDSTGGVPEVTATDPNPPTTFDFTESEFPKEIIYKNNSYNLVLTKDEGLLLNKKKDKNFFS